ncbi:Uncharacterized [Moorella glycerini]|uniref:Uncharacterized protein n=1 Tax=Neomoorella stamsii TaxID=1266720 RepID=A0A9X7P4Y1_9FIRM|nr:hypothetical protein MOST_30080 [Moorella stamsii]CEP67890.1 Uncharacterized [Moorella glycerini]CEP68760.1 Uncharacterized [Moorella glycerini]
MERRVIVEVTGYCPYVDDNHSISVTCVETFFSRRPSPVRLPTNFKCKYGLECGRSKECPLFKEIEVNPYLLI